MKPGTWPTAEARRSVDKGTAPALRQRIPFLAPSHFSRWLKDIHVLGKRRYDPHQLLQMIKSSVGRVVATKFDLRRFQDNIPVAARFKSRLPA